MMAETWIATRILTDADGRPALDVRLGLPREEAPLFWLCAFALWTPGSEGDVKTAAGADAMQALTQALEGIRITIRDGGHKFSWGGGEPGVTGFHRVPYSLGVELVDMLEGMIDAQSDKYAHDLMAGLIPRSAWLESVRRSSDTVVSEPTSEADRPAPGSD